MAGLIPVRAMAEPGNFDRDVREPGHAWLREQNIDLDSQLPPKAAAGSGLLANRMHLRRIIL